MRIKDIYDYIKLDTFSGTVVRIGTTTHGYQNEPDRQVTCLDVTIASHADPEKEFLYKVGIIEFMERFKDGSISVGDALTIRKYPFQTIWNVKQHIQVYKMNEDEKAAVRYLVECGVKELSRRARMRHYEYGSNDLAALQLEGHALRAIVLRTKLG